MQKKKWKKSKTLKKSTISKETFEFIKTNILAEISNDKSSIIYFLIHLCFNSFSTNIIKAFIFVFQN